MQSKIAGIKNGKIRKVGVLILTGMAFSVVLLGACAPSPAEVSEPVATSHGNEIGGYVDLVDALRGAGATVEPTGEVNQPFFDVTGQVIKVNGAEVQVFEFADETARKGVSDQIPPSGSPIGTTMVTWIDQPNFWAKGDVIVLYIGQDEATIDLLTSVLGEPLTEAS
ncbi:MAG TPA: hypothetical protein VE136_00470 [Anaerolineales bacterium]|nr:hypothetical protein [Anaerolineales bacterium]